MNPSLSLDWNSSGVLANIQRRSQNSKALTPKDLLAIYLSEWCCWLQWLSHLVRETTLLELFVHFSVLKRQIRELHEIFRIWRNKNCIPIGSMYVFFPYIYHKNNHSCRWIYITLMLWDWLLKLDTHSLHWHMNLDLPDVIFQVGGPQKVLLFSQCQKQSSLGVLAHLLRMVREPEYYAFRRWLDTPIIIWEYDWIPRGCCYLSYGSQFLAMDPQNKPAKNWWPIGYRPLWYSNFEP